MSDQSDNGRARVAMTRPRRRAAARVGVGALLAAALAAEQRPPAPPVATFGTGTDLVRIDVSVLDKDRKPVRGLAAADFTIVENGRERPVVAFTAVELPSLDTDVETNVATPASWIREAPQDVVSNTRAVEGRLVIIAFDWSLRFNDQETARRVAHATINGLGPADQAAIIFTRPNQGAGVPQNFTSDRALLRAAVDRPFAAAELELIRPPNNVTLVDIEGYESGDCHCRTCSMTSLSQVADTLRSVSDRPKVLFLITSWVRAVEPPVPVRRPPPVPGVMQPAWSALPGACTVPLDDARQALERAASSANAVVHVIDAVGLETGESTPLGSARRIRERQDALPVLSDMTGGRAVVNTNAPETLVPSILDESSSYYLLGFAPLAAVGDTRTQRIEVKTRVRGVTVHARASYRRADDPVSTISTEDRALVGAVGGVLPSAEVPFDMSVVPFITGPQAETSAVVVARLRGGAGGGTVAVMRNGVPTVDLLAAVFTPFGKVVTSKRRIVELQSARTADGVVEGHGVMSELPIEPGRYEVRVAAELAPGRAGSAHAFIDVPDFAREPLSMSGVLVHVEPSDVLEPQDEVRRLPTQPTARRSFAQSESVSALVQVSQGTARTDSMVAVTVVTRVTDAAGHDVLRENETFGADAFVGRVLTRTIELPTGRLAPGRYLLRIRVTAGKLEAERSVRFGVR